MSGLTVSIRGRNGAFAIEVPVLPLRGRHGFVRPFCAGKTTLLKMIAGTLRPENGRIAVGDFTLFDAQKA